LWWERTKSLRSLRGRKTRNPLRREKSISERSTLHPRLPDFKKQGSEGEKKMEVFLKKPISQNLETKHRLVEKGSWRGFDGVKKKNRSETIKETWPRAHCKE